jgi:hypothetical protein
LTSERKITANRANARASTGPQTTRGRARAARNALRHALSLPVCSIPALSEEVETLAREIAGPAANAATKELARRVADPFGQPQQRGADRRLFWALLASGQISMRKVDGWQTLARNAGGQPIDLAA